MGSGLTPHVRRRASAALTCAVFFGLASGSAAGPRFDRVAGTYVQSTGYEDATLIVAKDGTFERQFANNDAGAPPRKERGTVRLEGRTLTVRTERPGSVAPSTESYVVVPWGAWVYLVRPEQLRNFCMDFNRGTLRLRFLPYYIRAAGSAPTGLPDVPPPWGEWLLPAPVVAKVSAILPEGDLEIDAGSAEGLRVGMWLGAKEPFRSGAYEVMEVGEHRARVRHTERGTQPPTPVGALLGTRP